MGEAELQPVPDAGAAGAQVSPGTLHTEPDELWPGGTVPLPRPRHRPALPHASLGPKDARTGEWLLAWAFPAFGCLLASPVSAAPRGPAQRRWSNLSSGRGSWLRPLAGLPMYLLFLARGATTERSRLLPTASAWEQGTRRGAQAQIIAVLCCLPTDQPSWISQGQAALTY